MPRQLLGTAIASNTITTTQLQTTVVNQISAGGGPRVSSLIYPGDDTAANTAGGQTVYVVGSGFAANANVYINGNAVPSISFISASNLAITTPALSAATYPVYVINPETGATAIHIPGLRVSGDPSWVTASGSLSAAQDEASAWSYTVSATSDSAVTYALAGGSSLPTGISLAANGLISGTLSSPPGTETTYNFTVVATDAENQNASRAFSVTVSSGEGALFANNVLLIHADGTNNKNNHTFLDSSNNNFTITRYGNATQGSFSPFSQTGWSNYFDGSSDHLLVTAGSSSWADFGTGDFTISAWIFTPSVSALQGVCGSHAAGQDNTWQFRLNGSTFEMYGAGSAHQCSTAVQANKWVFLTASRSGTSLYVSVNGAVNTVSISSGGLFSASANVSIGNLYSSPSNYWFTGFISNLRILKGTALYTSNFTPPTAALTAVANTQLLTCQSNRFVDNSTNAFTLTRNGDVSVQAFSPFAPTTAYSTSSVGGSGYFDGSGDYLTVPAGSAFAYGTGDFTVEGWFYATAEPAAFGSTLFAQTISGTNYFICTLGSDASPSTRVVRFQFGTSGGGTGISTSATYNLNTWNHFAIVRNSGSVTVYLNGVGGTSGSCTQNFSDTSYVPTIGRYTHSDTCLFTGYLSNFRVVKGTAVYTTNFTPPTAPVTAIANTSLLCNFTNAGIFDQTAKNVLETVGDAKVSTAQYKYGTGSISFDGSGDRLYRPAANDPLTNLGIGGEKFTVEQWVYFNSVSGTQMFSATKGGGTGGWNSSSGHQYLLGFLENGTYYIQVWNGSGISSYGFANPFSTGQWYHHAVTYDGTTTRTFIDGVQRGSGSITYVAVSSPSRFVIGDSPAYDAPFNGYIDDFRITKGYARYTSNFTAPTSAFKDK